MINDPSLVGINQQPRALVFVNGNALPGVLEISVDNNNFFQSDSFSVTVARAAIKSDNPFIDWDKLTTIEVEILIGFPSDPSRFSRGDLTSFLVGYADDLEFDPVNDVIHITGRDLTSKLIDFKRAISFSSGSLKASDVVTQIANERGLTPRVTATPIPTGTYSQIIHSLVKSNSTYWDIIVRLAQIEGYQAYVKGKELVFEPRVAPSADPYVLQYIPPTDSRGDVQLNATEMTFSRNLSVSKDIKVVILSYDTTNKKAISETATRTKSKTKTRSGINGASDPPQEYVYNIPGLTADKARARAQKKLEELSAHEMNVRAVVPGDVILTAQNIVKVEGTNTAFDQTYFVSSVVRRIHFETGFTMAISGKNQAPE